MTLAGGSAAPTLPRPGLPRAVDRSGAMGGQLGIHVVVADDAGVASAERDAARVAARVRAWASRLTRHAPTSDLMLANADPRSSVPIRPTLAAALRWAEAAADLTGGIVDATLLRERLAAESIVPAEETSPAEMISPTDARVDPGDARRSAAGRRADWYLENARQRGALLHRDPSVAFDLDGVAKGWIADRALALLDRHPGALVDADGDIAIRSAAGDAWEIGVADPRSADRQLATFVLPGSTADARYGVATSGISVHRWAGPDGGRHHLIDPRTGRPAATDVIQATVLAANARVAERGPRRP